MNVLEYSVNSKKELLSLNLLSKKEWHVLKLLEDNTVVIWKINTPEFTKKELTPPKKGVFLYINWLLKMG